MVNDMIKPENDEGDDQDCRRDVEEAGGLELAQELCNVIDELKNEKAAR
jgi:hypothetical protein